MNAYGGLGRSSQGMMSPMTSGYGTACKLLIELKWSWTYSLVLEWGQKEQQPYTVTVQLYSKSRSLGQGSATSQYTNAGLQKLHSYRTIYMHTVVFLTQLKYDS